MATSEQVIGTIILIVFYSALIIYFVIRGAQKTKSLSDYAVGNVNFSPIFVGLSLAVSMTSAATFVINPGLIAVYGISGVISFGIVFPLASIISLIILTKSFRKFGKNLKALTLAQWIGKRYDSKYYALFMGFLSLLLITFIVLILVALTKVLSKALNANEIIVLAGIIVFVFGYMMFGGANSLVYTNTIQAVVMLIVAFILLFSGYNFFEGGIGSFIDRLAAIDPVLIKSTNSQSPLFRDFYEIIFAQIFVGIAVVCQPHIITKSLFIKKEKDVNKFLVTVVIAELIFFSVVFVGLYARIGFPDLTFMGEKLNVDGIITAYVIKIFANGIVSVIIGLFVILGLISAGLSTLEGLIQSLSTTITSDIIEPLFANKIKKEKTYININRLAIIFLAVISFFMSVNQLINPKLSVAILAQNGVYAYFSTAFIPIVFGIYIKKVDIKVPVIASIVALTIHFIIYYGLPILVKDYGFNFGFATKYLSGTIRNPAVAASTAIIISSVTGLIIHQITKKKIIFNTLNN